MSLSSLLSAPQNHLWDKDDENSIVKGKTLLLFDKIVNSIWFFIIVNFGALTKAVTSAPPYGQRRGFIPRTETDYGDGGAFPEIAVAQYPLGMFI